MVWTVLPAEEEAARKIQLKLSKKRSVSYVVKRTGKSNFRDSVTTTTSEVTYKISVEEAKDNGDLVLSAAYASLKANSDSERRPYDFDSSK